MSAEEFRPEDLPLGWEHSPAEDERDWLTKETELTYYNLCANEDYRITYFTERAAWWWQKQDKESHMAKILKKNPLFIHEPPYVKKLETEAEGVLTRYSCGKLLVAGDNRFLSGDLLSLLWELAKNSRPKDKRQQTFWGKALGNRFPDSSFYAPKAAYQSDEACTILRNPHIARNEELQLFPHNAKDNMRHFYLGHLSDVVDDVIADALLLGSLKNYEVAIPEDHRQRIEKTAGKNAAPYICDLIAYYHAHKEADCDWVLLPVTSFDMYYGGSYFSKRILSTIPEEILVRKNNTGTCLYCVSEEYRL